MPDGHKDVYHEIGSFTPYALNSNIWVIPIGLIAEQSCLQSTKMYILGPIPMGPSVLELSHACHLRYDLIFQGDFQPLSELALARLQSLKPHRVVPNNLGHISLSQCTCYIVI